MPATPGELFVQLWIKASNWPPNFRTASPKVDALRCHKIQFSLAHENGADTITDLLALLAIEADNSINQRALIFEIMRALDMAFYEIHPRALTSAHFPKRARQSWLEDASDSRHATGAYSEWGEYRLIARGPLLRRERPENADSADSLANRFSALSVVKAKYNEAGRPIQITHKLVFGDSFRGVRPGKNDGAEKVVFLPVAETADEIQIEDKSSNDRHFLDYKASDKLNVRERIIQGLESAGNSDIAIAPELVVSDIEANHVCDAMPFCTAEVRLFVAGSGHTLASDELGMHWNEARVVNGLGAELWRQRKLWPACIDGSSAQKLGVDARNDKDYYEFNASGNELLVVDVESMGRCIVLICQDILAEPLVSEVIRSFQPDWIFSPILDHDVERGRWAHRYAFSLSRLSPARFIFSTSTSFCRKLGCADARACGMAVGPFAGDGADDKDRMCATVRPELGHATEFATVQWRSGCPKWQSSKLTVTAS